MAQSNLIYRSNIMFQVQTIVFATIGVVITILTVALVQCGYIRECKPRNLGIKKTVAIYLAANAISFVFLLFFTDKNPFYGFVLAIPLSVLFTAIYSRFSAKRLSHWRTLRASPISQVRVNFFSSSFFLIWFLLHGVHWARRWTTAKPGCKPRASALEMHSQKMGRRLHKIWAISHPSRIFSPALSSIRCLFFLFGIILVLVDGQFS